MSTRAPNPPVIPDSRPRKPVVEAEPRLDRHSRVLAVREREAAFERIGSARRWVIGGAAGLSAALAALAYGLAPGHTLSSAHAATPAPSSGSGASGPAAMPPAAGPSQLGLGGGGGDESTPAAPAAPSSAPSPAPAQSSPPVVSGGS